MKEWEFFLCIIIWLVCGLITTWLIENHKDFNPYPGGIDWDDILFNLLLGPIKLGCLLIGQYI